MSLHLCPYCGSLDTFLCEGMGPTDDDDLLECNSCKCALIIHHAPRVPYTEEPK